MAEEDVNVRSSRKTAARTNGPENDQNNTQNGRVSIAARATKVARTSVLLALLGAAVTISLLQFSWQGFQDESVKARVTLIEAHDAVGEIRLMQERLTMSANMAAATGRVQWIDRYNENFERLGEVFGRMMQLAPAAVATNFQRQAGPAIDRYVTLEQQALKEVTGGYLRRAQQILSSDAHGLNKTVIEANVIEFNKNVVAAVAGDLEGQIEAHNKLMIALGVLSILAGFLLWRGLFQALRKSEIVFLAAEEEIRHLATSDGLTGVGNRRTFEEILDNLASAPEEKHFAVFMIDLDEFKPVNDLHGHLAGDHVLQVCAERLSAIFGSKGQVCRYGGDEFAVVSCGIEQDVSAVHRVGQEIVRELSAPIPMDDVFLQIGVSVGIAISSALDAQSDILISEADIALYQVKHAGGDGVRVYDSDMEGEAIGRAKLVADLKKSIAHEEIMPYFQPIMDMETGNVCGFEVLAFWQHPENGLMEPEGFVPVAEAAGMIGDLFLNLLRAACESGRTLPSNTYISIRVSARQLHDEWLATKILSVLSESGFPPARLQVEITEASIAGDFVAARRTLTSLKNIGVQLALDDFGTGQSSLHYLAELGFARVKIDRSFVRSLEAKSQSRNIVNALVGLSDSLGVAMIAEGVESADDENRLKEAGCRAGQGFLYGQPMPEGKVEAFLDHCSNQNSTPKKSFGL